MENEKSGMWNGEGKMGHITGQMRFIRWK